MGAGGNATVWVATENADEIALKVLNTPRQDREPYKRFVREIQFLQSLKDSTGVLPIIEAHLPDQPGSNERPWLAMPIATGIRTALQRASLETVVQAMSEVATTLARLAEEGVAHRDIKPGNLYALNEAWLVGDFGLVKVPDVDDLTRHGQPLGPAHFTAYEMIADPVKADPFPADVYSLCKTLWVLATDQNFPPAGHQPAKSPGYSIVDLRPHPHAGTLDALIERGTRLRPADRPTMRQAAADLKAWLKLSATPIELDVSSLGARLREKIAGELSADELLRARKDEALAAVRRYQELIAPLNRSLQELLTSAEIDRMDDKLTQNILRTHGGMGRPPAVFLWQRCSQIGRGPSHHRYTLRMGRSVELSHDGQLTIRALIAVGYPTLGGADVFWQAPERTAPVGSIEVEQILQQTVNDVRDQLAIALEVFAGHGD